MNLDSANILWLVVAAVGACCALGVWFVFLRPVPRLSARAVIVEKRFRQAGTRWIQPVGRRSNFWMPVAMPIAEGYAFTCRLDDGTADAIALLNVSQGERFQVGQSVTIEYQRRGFGPLWQRTYVLEMRAAADG